MALTGNSALYFDGTFDNSGTVSTSGTNTLYIEAGNSGSNTDTGTYNVAPGAAVNFDSGTRTIGSKASFPGAGPVIVDGASLGFSAANTITNLQLNNGTVTGPSTVTVPSGGTLGLNGGSLNGAHLINQGTGTDTGQITFNNSSILENAGTLSLTDATTLVPNDSSANLLQNDATGTISYGTTTNAYIRINLPVSNAGTVALTGNSALYFDGTFDNSGTVSTSGTNTLYIEAGNSGSNTDTGTYNVAPGAAVNFDSGTRTIGSKASFPGAGPVIVDGASLGFSAANTITNLQLNNGTVTGPSTVTVPSGGTLGLNGGSLNGAHLINQGTGTDTGQITFNNSSILENAGTLSLTDATTLVPNDSSANLLQNDATGTISYVGSSTSSGDNVSLTTTNTGIISVTKGTLTLSLLTNLNTSTGTLTGGTYRAVGGTLSLGASLKTNSATIVLGGTGMVSTGSTNALATLLTNTSSGTLQLSRNLTITGSFANSGKVSVLMGTLQVGSYHQSAGTTTVAPGAVLKGGTSGTTAVAINGGILTGTGTVSGVLTNQGIVEPSGAGDIPMTAFSTYSQSGTGELLIPIAGSVNPGTDFGQISVTGGAALGGNLTVATASGYIPSLGTTFTILKAASVSGTFATVTGNNLPNNEGYAVSYSPTSVMLTVANAPTVTSVNPVAGPLAGGTVVTVTGNFLAGATVLFGTTPATNVQVNGTGLAQRHLTIERGRHSRREGHGDGPDICVVARRPVHLRPTADDHWGGAKCRSAGWWHVGGRHRHQPCRSDRRLRDHGSNQCPSQRDRHLAHR